MWCGGVVVNISWAVAVWLGMSRMYQHLKPLYKRTNERGIEASSRLSFSVIIIVMVIYIVLFIVIAVVIIISNIIVIIILYYIRT